MISDLKVLRDLCMQSLIYELVFVILPLYIFVILGRKPTICIVAYRE